MSRARTFASMVPLAAVEPDGLLVTTTGGTCGRWSASGCSRRGPAGAHSATRSANGSTLSAHASLPGQGSQIVVEAEALDRDRAQLGPVHRLKVRRVPDDLTAGAQPRRRPRPDSRNTASKAAVRSVAAQTPAFRTLAVESTR